MKAHKPRDIPIKSQQRQNPLASGTYRGTHGTKQSSAAPTLNIPPVLRTEPLPSTTPPHGSPNGRISPRRVSSGFGASPWPNNENEDDSPTTPWPVFARENEDFADDPTQRKKAPSDNDAGQSQPGDCRPGAVIGLSGSCREEMPNLNPDVNPGARYFPASVLLELSDWAYEVRKSASAHFEVVMSRMIARRDYDGILEVIAFVRTEYILSSNINARKGGLLALAECAVGLGPREVGPFCGVICESLFPCFQDEDYKVRYYTCEALYNIAKIARIDIIPLFNKIFAYLCVLTCDKDLSVKNSCQVLDRLMKDIISEYDKFDVREFIKIIEGIVYSPNPSVRQFIIGWIVALDSVPYINMLEYLPNLLEGVFMMLSDPNKEIRRISGNALTDFLIEIKAYQDIEFNKLSLILLGKCHSTDEYTRLTALNWCKEFVILGQEKMLVHGPQFINAILVPISDKNGEIREAARISNNEFMKLYFNTKEYFDFSKLIQHILPRIKDRHLLTRLASLNWFLLLFEKAPDVVSGMLDMFFDDVLQRLGDDSEKVVRASLALMCCIMPKEPLLTKFILAIIQFFKTHPDWLLSRGHFIFETISLELGEDVTYTKLSGEIEKEKDLSFASIMSQILHVIVLSSPHFIDTRARLKAFDVPGNDNFFKTVYKLCCHSPVSILSLCLFTHAYEHASFIISELAKMDPSLGLLLELDKLVYVLETNPFAVVRLHLLEPTKYPFLYQCLYGILMVIPQGPAFEVLKMRLTCMTGISPLVMLNDRDEVELEGQVEGDGEGEDDGEGESVGEKIPSPVDTRTDWASLGEYFTFVRRQHEANFLSRRPIITVDLELRIPKIKEIDMQIYRDLFPDAYTRVV